MKYEMKKLNWDYIMYALKEKGYTMKTYSVKLGKNDSYLSQIKCGYSNMQTDVLNYMIKDVPLDENCLFEKQELPKPKLSVDEAIEQFRKPEGLVIPEDSDFEVFVQKALNDIDAKLEMLLELESKLNHIIAFLPQVSPSDKAANLLQEMMKMGTPDYNDYVRRLNLSNIDKDYAHDAILRAGCEVKQTGYGHSKRPIIVKKNTAVVTKGAKRRNEYLQGEN